MSEPSPLAEFTGKARLFPLPNLVFFPHVMQPLHIFEPRYRQMTADALAGDRFIALVLPTAGWEKDYNDAPNIHPVACLGHIIAFALPLDAAFKQALLEELRVAARLQVLHDFLEGAKAVKEQTDRKFPPEFSAN